MKKTKKALASLAIAGMVLSMAPMSVFAADATTRLSGADRVATAIAVATNGWATGSDNVIVVSADDANIVDALAAAPLAGQLNAPILVTYKGALDASVQQKIVDLKAKNVYAIGALSDATVASLKAIAGVTVEQLQGADRTETAAKVTAKLSKVNGSFVVAYDGKADALSAASFAAANGYSIVIANPDGTIPSTEKVVAPTYTVGGQVSVTGATALKGADRYATNAAVVDGLTFSYDKVYVANGETLVDALAGAPLAAKTKSPIVLADATQAVTAANDNLTTTSQVIALGGVGAVSDAVLGKVAYQVPATLTVVSVEAIDGKDIKVTFNKAAAKDSLINPANYTATFTTGSGLSLDTNSDNYVVSDDRTNVIIPVTGGNFYNGQGYKVGVKNLIDDDYKTMTEYKDSWHLFNDTTAPVLQSAAKKSGKLRLYFNEAVRPGMTVKVDGIVENTVVVPATAAGDNYANVTVSADALKTGTHNVMVYNAADWVGTSGNIAPLQTATYTVTDDTTAPSVASVTADGGTTFKVKFSETLSNITTSNIVVKKGNATLTTQGATQDADDTTVWNVTVAGTSDVDLYESAESSTTLSVTVKGYYDASNLYGAEYNTTITLTKDTIGPVIVNDAFNSSTNGALTLKFNEDLNTSFSFDASKITVVKDNVLKTVDAATVSGKSLVLTINGGVTDGSYSVQLAKGTVKDKSNNDNNALSTVVTYSATNGSAYYGIGSIVVGTVGSANTITIPYGVKMTATAVDTTNYQLDGMPLPVGSSAYFTGTNQDTVQIKLPAGTVDSNVQRLLAFSKNIKTDDGRVVMTSSKNELTATITGFADNVKPVLSAAKFVITSLSDTTTSAIRLTFNENMGVVSDADDFKVSVNGIKVAVSSVIDTTANDKYITLQLAGPINMSQSVTVEVVKAADQADTATLVADIAGNTLTEGTVVSVSDKTTSN